MVGQRSDESKLQCSEDEKRRWDDRSDEYKQVRSEDDKMTYENFLPGQQKKQHITLSMEQMRMVHISSSLKYLVPMT